MTLAQPGWLWLLALITPFILLLHTRRRSDVLVPNLAVWRQVTASGATKPDPRRINWRDRHLWLQLGASIVAATALAGPVIGAGAAPLHWIVLVDTSSSMNATDVRPSRFGAAVAGIVDRWGRRGLVGEISLVSVGATARVIAALWPLGPEARRAAERLRIGEGEPDWAGAALRAAHLASTERIDEVRVVVVTDPYGVAAARAALEVAGVRPEVAEFHIIGGPLVNIGVADVELAERGEGPDQWTAAGTLTSSGFATGDVVRVTAAFRFPGTEVFLPWGGAEVAIGAGGEVDFAIPLDLPGRGELRISGPVGDHLAVDDSVILTVRHDPLRVGLLGPTPAALLRALASTGNVEAFSVDAALASESLGSFDLVIITGESAVVPATSTLWLGFVPAGVDEGVALDPTESQLSVGSHVLAADIDPRSLTLTLAQPLAMLAGAEPLIYSSEGVFAWARTVTTGRQVVIGFDLESSDWASQVSFPAFIAGLLEWSAPRRAGFERACEVGEACAFPREAATTGAELFDPYDAPVRLISTPRPIVGDPLASAVWDQALFDAGFVPSRSGAYRLITGDTSLIIPVMPASVGLQPEVAEVRGDSYFVPSARPLWRWLAVTAGTLIILESYLAYKALQPAVRRRSRTSLLLVGVAGVAVILAVTGVPLPVLSQGGSITWVGPAASGPWYQNLSSIAPGWRTRWEQTSTLAQTSSTKAIDNPATQGVLAGAVGYDLAIEMATAGTDGAGGQRVVVAAVDKESTAADEAAKLAALAGTHGIVLDVVHFPSDGEGLLTPSEGGLARLEMPRGVHAGAPFVIEAIIDAPESVSWTLTATLSSFRQVREDPVSDTPTPTRLGRSVQLLSETPEPTKSAEVMGVGPGAVELEFLAGGQGELVYLLELVRSDLVDAVESTVVIQVDEHSSVLMVALDDFQGVTLGSALVAQGIAVTRSTPFSMPASLVALSDFDAVILVNVPASAMFPEFQALLERYVRETGAGLLMFGGTSAFGPGGYFATPLESLSPLSSLVTDEAPEVAMVFVLDRSGSMSGAAGGSSRMDVAKLATLQAITLLGEDSQAAVIVFDTEAREVVPFTSVLDRQAFERALTGVVPAGGTSIHPGLEAAFRVLQASTAATRHVIVMTDGLSQEGDFATVIGALNDLGVSTSFVGVGSAADRRQLSTLAALSNGALHMATDFRALPSLLAQEALMLAAEPIVESRIDVRWPDQAASPDFLSGIAGTQLPALMGFIKTTAKPEAEVHLQEIGDDDPILATWRYGLGRVAAFASEADGEWSRSWASDGFYPRLWSQVARWVAENPVRDDWTLRYSGSGDLLDVVLELPVDVGSDAELPFIELWLGDDRLAARPLEHAGRGMAAARFEVGSSLSGLFELRVDIGEGFHLAGPLRQTIPWPPPPVGELRHDLVSLGALAVASGGSAKAIADYDVPAVRRVLAWVERPNMWLLGAMLGFLLALAVRYGGSFTLLKSR